MSETAIVCEQVVHTAFPGLSSLQMRRGMRLIALDKTPCICVAVATQPISLSAMGEYCMG
jgi:hypothetical protein